MKLRRYASASLITVLIASLPWMAVPASAADSGAALRGMIVRAADQSPLPGAKLHASDAETGKIFSSAPASRHGSFRLEGLPPATYALAVESAGGFFLVEAPVSLAPGATRTVNLAVNPQPMDRDEGATADEAAWGFWENPLTAALIVAGSAVLVGVAFDDDSSDEVTATQTAP